MFIFPNIAISEALLSKLDDVKQRENKRNV